MAEPGVEGDGNKAGGPDHLEDSWCALNLDFMLEAKY